MSSLIAAGSFREPLNAIREGGLFQAVTHPDEVSGMMQGIHFFTGGDSLEWSTRGVARQSGRPEGYTISDHCHDLSIPQTSSMRWNS
jgi:hypothetical protein